MYLFQLTRTGCLKNARGKLRDDGAARRCHAGGGPIAGSIVGPGSWARSMGPDHIAASGPAMARNATAIGQNCGCSNTLHRCWRNSMCIWYCDKSWHACTTWEQVLRSSCEKSAFISADMTTLYGQAYTVNMRGRLSYSTPSRERHKARESNLVAKPDTSWRRSLR